MKPSHLARVERIYRRRVDPSDLVGPEFARFLTELSREIRRQIGALIDRAGNVEFVIVGDARRIDLPDFKRVRVAPGRLRGLRLVHTHLKGEPLNRDDLTDLTMLRLDMVAALAAGEDGLPGQVFAAHLNPDPEAAERCVRMEFAHPSLAVFDCRSLIESVEEELTRRIGQRKKGVAGKDAVLAGVYPDLAAMEESMSELAELAQSAGYRVADRLTQLRPRPDPKFIVGRGKLEELVVRSMSKGCELLIFDGSLTPAQTKAISDMVELRVIDRTFLILEIFEKRATTSDGKIQVELARLKYTLPRLASKQEDLSRLTGGIGARGPGETKLEEQRRRALKRIRKLEEEIEKMAMSRMQQKARRQRNDLPVVSIIGYTNAGKSALLNAMTRSEAVSEARMFATLDPASRRLRFPRDRSVIITDTVGFIRDLPPDLMAAFRATLEELRDADLFVHVVDASNPRFERHIGSVQTILDRLGMLGTPQLLALNKCDLLTPERRRALALHHGGLAVSARTGEGLDVLASEMELMLWRRDESPEKEFSGDALRQSVS